MDYGDKIAVSCGRLLAKRGCLIEAENINSFLECPGLDRLE
jgi:hypothetical protein